MKNLRPVFTLILAIAAMLAVASVSQAVAPDPADALSQRMRSLDQTFTTPPSVSLDQRWLQITAIAAFETQTTDPDLIMDAYLSAGSLVTYYLHADTNYLWTGSAWELESRDLYTYTSGNLTETIMQDWDGSQWLNTFRSVQTYDGSNRLLTSMSQVWEVDMWANSSLLTYTYNGSGLVSELVFQSWVAEAWVNFFKSLFTYSGNRLDTTISQVWDGSVWVNQGRNTYTYNGSDQVTTILNEGWNDPVWVSAILATNTYTGGNLTQSLNQSWAGQWNNLSKRDYAYDGSNNEILSVGYGWVSNNWNANDTDTSRYVSNRLSERVYVTLQPFLYVSRDLFTYDGSGNLIEEIGQADIVGTWTNGSRTTYTYSTSGIFDDDASSVPSGFGLAQNYPNPFNLSTVIPYSLASDSHVKVTVSNILGQTISTVVDEFQFGGTHAAVWNGHDSNGREVGSGVYFFRVQVGAAAQVRKMVLLK